MYSYINTSTATALVRTASLRLPTSIRICKIALSPDSRFIACVLGQGDPNLRQSCICLTRISELLSGDLDASSPNDSDSKLHVFLLSSSYFGKIGLQTRRLSCQSVYHLRQFLANLCLEAGSLYRLRHTCRSRKGATVFWE